MLTISVSDLKARLSEQLRRVKAGERLIVTDRGTPVAMLAPLDAAHLQDEMTELIEAGLVRPPQEARDADFLERPRPADPKASLRSALADERAQGW
jgi:prevent-host-death family protein